eukprot:TRINITY_DN40128_c0_g1_i1.p1 TRINITY_DN40128_c0_g1~~TRINITY_DN40128_c0_g1_i1.p1  ORF type:complete len:749 (+),score=57.57 TRINITY_DN40128_c0_g1_i1:1456-3702(+)
MDSMHPIKRHAQQVRARRTSLVFALLVLLWRPFAFATLQGQSQANRLRHSVAVSDLPSRFGKKSSAVLKRTVVPRSKLWAGTLDPFIAQMFQDTGKLDWFVADVIGDLVTINGAFSCLDRGMSTSYGLTWWASENLTELTELRSEPGGAEIHSFGDIRSPDDAEATVHDITEQCLQQRRRDPSLRVVEHHGVHDGSGVAFRRFGTNTSSSFIGDVDVFDKIFAKRSAEDRSNHVVYLGSLALVYGLTFDSGFRIKVPHGFTTEKTLDLRVPMTALAAITHHTAARMQEENIGRGEPKTNGWILTLYLLSSALPLFLAIWMVSEFVVSTAYKSAMKLRELPVQKAIRGGEEHWLKHNKATLTLHIVGAIILAAPLVLGIVERQIDPRPYVELTQGITVFYGSSQQSLSRDPSNPVAGAPFLVTAWISFRELNGSYHRHILLCTLFITFIAALIIWRDMVRISMFMPYLSPQGAGFSLPKLIGRLKLWLGSKKGEREEYYTLLITLRQEYVDTLQLDATQGMHWLKTMPLLVNKGWRSKANNFAAQDREEWCNSGADLYDRLMSCVGDSGAEMSFLVHVKLDNKIRLKALLSKTRRWWHDMCPREWEYVRRSLPGCGPLEEYHTRGQYPPDAAAVLLRLGFVDYLQYIEKVYVKKWTDRDRVHGDNDTRCFVVLSAPATEVLTTESPPLSEDFLRSEQICFHFLERWRDAPTVLRNWREGRMRIESIHMNGQRFGYAREPNFDLSALSNL